MGDAGRAENRILRYPNEKETSGHAPRPRRPASPLHPRPTPTPASSTSDPVLVGAGDIASCDSGGDEETAALLDTIAGHGVHAGRQRLPQRDRQAVSPSATTRPGVGTRRARGRCRATTTTARPARPATSATSAAPPAIRDRATTATTWGRGASWSCSTATAGRSAAAVRARRRSSGCARTSPAHPSAVHARDTGTTRASAPGVHGRRTGHAAALAGALRRGRGRRARRPRPQLRALRPAERRPASADRERGHPRVRRRHRRPVSHYAFGATSSRTARSANDDDVRRAEADACAGAPTTGSSSPSRAGPSATAAPASVISPQVPKACRA